MTSSTTATSCTRGRSTSRPSTATMSSPSASGPSARSAGSSRPASTAAGTPSSETGWALWTSRRASRAPSQHETVLRSAREAGDVAAVEKDDRHGRTSGEGQDRPRRSEDDREERERHGGDHRGDRGVARREEDDAGGRNGLARLREAEEERPPVPDHRSDAGQDSDEVVAEPAAEQCGGEPLSDVEGSHREAELEAERAPHVRSPWVAAADRSDVDPGDESRDPVPPRHAPEEIADSDKKDLAHHAVHCGASSGRTRSGLDLVLRDPPVLTRGNPWFAREPPPSECPPDDNEGGAG